MENYPKKRHWAIIVLWWLGAQINSATAGLNTGWFMVLFISIFQALLIYGIVYLLTFLWRKAASYMPPIRNRGQTDGD